MSPDTFGKLPGMMSQLVLSSALISYSEVSGDTNLTVSITFSYCPQVPWGSYRRGHSISTERVLPCLLRWDRTGGTRERAGSQGP